MDTKDTVLTFRPDPQVHAAMQALREDEGVPFSEQIRRALRAWLESKGRLTPKFSSRAEVGAIKRRTGGRVVDRRLEPAPKKR